MNGVNNHWLQAFQEIQHNTLQAQMSFQETMAESHRLFLETSQMAFQHLGHLMEGDSGPAPSLPQRLPSAAPLASAPRLAPVAPRISAPPAPVISAPPVALAPPPANSRSAVAETPSLARAIPKPPLAAAVAPAIPASPAAPAKIDLEDALLTIVANKTGYPKEILDLATDLESGLGIDSIKRVEILAAAQDIFPDLKSVDKAKLASLNTLGEILSYAQGGEPMAAVLPVAENAGAADHAGFQKAMLQIVADKTGYPLEILEMDTDLESGLGIDSIKRVEILSALQEKFPALKAVDTAKLASMNTLGEIMGFAMDSSAFAETAAGEVKKKVAQGVA